ncbi:BglG family transcription antiterminator [Staphylococcus simiae]|uniref:BglG family transcription antiterminator n=1 Tax=Staphylococcus simiae TaxID=308354 RepID=UPI001A978B0A|nr:BglG family transcription antiterminator [Staphylococcus simiae]MBO1198719.1 BglG family transcription antiterminator [Staphylococcus simiae]MBO1200971.1 BglG family transcription antiterminator [Staphylococcus simiae]MBO1203184.1 BglG family transcription antiterminator [Staphylococcus simiae]MBO1210708.1 BglG family transcription antiterminator [Staphylococcus simiae]MBO1229309.1 BglG family transcription antiterminator [Staphylococcus simiae]
MLSQRQLEILHLLVTEENYVTISYLATHFGVSKRTIQYDLEFIEQYSKSLNYDVTRHKAYGVKVSTTHANLQHELEHTSVGPIHLSKDERITQLMLKLFESGSPITSKQLSEYVHVSRRTIADDLKLIQLQLDNFHLQLNYISNKGFNISGNEDNYRKAYAYYIQQYVKQAAPFIESDIFASDSVTIVRNIVITTLEEESYHLVQSAIDGLIYHILIAIQRLFEQRAFSVPSDEMDRLSQTLQYDIARKLIDKLERACDITFPQSETLFITLHLLGSRITDNSVASMSDETYLAEAIESFITYVGLDLGLEFQKDNKLLNSLSTHLKPAIYRIQFDITQHNPLKDEIYQRYPELVEAIQRHISLLEAFLNITFTKDELAFIAIHFASSIERVATETQQLIKVVLMCGSGIGTSQLLKSKLSHLYPEFHIIDAYSVYQLDENQLIQNDIDYVISTVPCNIQSIPVIIVDPFINQQSRQKLNQIINNARESRVAKMSNSGKSLAELLPSHRITVNDDLITKEQAIAQAVEPLIIDQIVDHHYVTAILDQFEKFGPYIVISPHVALIHASTHLVKNGAGFALTYFKQGVNFGSQHNDPVYVVITLATNHPNIHLKALGQLSELLTDNKIKQSFIDGDIPTIINAISQIKNKEV